MRRLCDLYVGHAMYSVNTVNSALVFVCVVLFLDLSWLFIWVFLVSLPRKKDTKWQECESRGSCEQCQKQENGSNVQSWKKSQNVWRFKGTSPCTGESRKGKNNSDVVSGLYQWDNRKFLQGLEKGIPQKRKKQNNCTGVSKTLYDGPKQSWLGCFCTFSRCFEGREQI